MIAEFGHAALWLAAALCGLQALVWARGVRGPDPPGDRWLRALAVAQGGLALSALLCLAASFAMVDQSVVLVAAHASASQPVADRIAALWGSDPGAMLLWVAILGVGGALVARTERRLDPTSVAGTLGVQAVIGAGFYALLLFGADPFVRQVAAAGQGLTPLGGDPGFALHLPMLYLGYAGLVVACSLAMGGVFAGAVAPPLARAMRPWVLGAWLWLTLGLAAGSDRVFGEVGQGSWWAWPPTETAGLLSWLASTALAHSVGVLAGRDGLRRWTMLLAIVACAMSMVAMVLARTGTPPGANASNFYRGGVLLLVVLYGGSAGALLARRQDTMRRSDRPAVLSREGALVANNLLLTALSGVVLVVLLYPLVVQAVGRGRMSAAPPWLPAIAGGLVLALAAAMTVGPAMAWWRDRPGTVLRRVAPALLAMAAVALLVRLARPDIAGEPWLALALAAGVTVASVQPLLRPRPWRARPRVWGMVLAHLGVAVLLAGVAGNAAFAVKRTVAARVGDAVPVGPWQVRLVEVAPTFGDGWDALEATLAARHGGGVLLLRPQARFYWRRGRTASEAAIHAAWDGRLSLFLEPQAADGRWPLRLRWQPFAMLIWLGSALMVAGGVASLLDRTVRAYRVRRRRALGWA